MVPNTSELLPEPEMPVKTVSRRFGSSTPTSLRLLTRAPWTALSSWLSAGCRAGAIVFAVLFAVLVLLMPSSLGDADEVAGRVADRAVAHAPGLRCGLLEHLGARCPHLLERGVEVVGTEDRRLQRTLRH